MANNQKLVQDYHEKLNFGKHKGKTWLEVLDEDPGYIVWTYENSIVKAPTGIVADARHSTLEPDFEDLHGNWDRG